MAFHVLAAPENAAGWLLSIILTPICILATLLRFVATKRSGRTVGWEDWWALLALIFFIPYVVYLLMALSEANGRSALQFLKQDPKRWTTLAQYGLMMNGLYGLQQTCVKYSLLALYHRIFWVDRKFVLMVWTAAVIQGMWGLVVLLCHIFACVPVKKSWYPKTPGRCININLFFSIYEPVNSALDFFVAGMAVYMLWKNPFHRFTKQVWWLSILFVLGAFSGIVGIVKTVQAQNSAKQNYLSVIWNLVQMATAIICCCAPIYKSIIPEHQLRSVSSWASGVFHRVTSHSKLSGSGSAAGKKGTDDSEPQDPAKYQPQPSSYDRQNGAWAPLDGSSEHELLWAKKNAMSGDDRQSEEKDSIPMRTVKIQQSTDLVRNSFTLEQT